MRSLETSDYPLTQCHIPDGFLSGCKLITVRVPFKSYAQRIPVEMAQPFMELYRSVKEQIDLVVHCLKCCGRTHLFVCKAEQWQSQKERYVDPINGMKLTFKPWSGRADKPLLRQEHTTIHSEALSQTKG